MTKQKYIAPRMEVIELEVQETILVASGETGSAGTGGGSVGDETEDLSTTKRGTWGNLWN